MMPCCAREENVVPSPAAAFSDFSDAPLGDEGTAVKDTRLPAGGGASGALVDVMVRSTRARCAWCSTVVCCLQWRRVPPEICL